MGFDVEEISDKTFYKILLQEQIIIKRKIFILKLRVLNANKDKRKVLKEQINQLALSLESNNVTLIALREQMSNDEKHIKLARK